MKRVEKTLVLKHSWFFPSLFYRVIIVITWFCHDSYSETIRIRPCTCSAGSWKNSQIFPETAFVAHVKIAMRWRTSARQFLKGTIWNFEATVARTVLEMLYYRDGQKGVPGCVILLQATTMCLHISVPLLYRHFSNSNHPWITRGDNKGGKLLTGTPFAASWASKHVFTIIRFDGHGIEPWESRGASSESVTTTQKSLPLFTWMFEGAIPSWIQHCIVFARVWGWRKSRPTHWAFPPTLVALVPKPALSALSPNPARGAISPRSVM